MFSYFKKPKLQTTVFVSAALLSLMIFGIFYLILAINYQYKNIQANAPADRYYLKDNLTASDPMLTKAPDLKQILAGPIISDRDPVLGSISAPVTIVIFSDFTCDYCRQQELVIQNILAKYQDRVRIIWKDYPESQTDSISFQSAQAARCAQEQNKFWTYHDLLFKNGAQLNQKILSQLAVTADLNVDKFNNCLKTGQTKKYVNDNITEANALEINGVPFFYVNDQEIIGQLSQEDLEKIIKLELSKQTDSGQSTNL